MPNDSFDREERATGVTRVVHDDEPCYVISVAAEMIRLHPQTLRRYEELGLVCPTRVSGKRMYSPNDVEKLRKISRITDDLGVNLAGVEVILRLTQQVETLQTEMDQMKRELVGEIARLRRMTGG